MWQFVGVVIAFAALIATILVPWILYLRQQQKKALEYLVQMSTPIFNPTARHDNLKLLFEEKPVHDVQLIVLRFANTGNVPILPTDYFVPISIEFAANSHVLEAELTQTSPENLSVKIIREGALNHAFVAPTLLNAGEGFTMQFLVASFKEGIKVDGRIAGVQIVKHRRGSGMVPMALMTLAVVVCIFVGMLMSQQNFSILSDVLWTVWWVLWMGFLSVYIASKNKREAQLFG